MHANFVVRARTQHMHVHVQTQTTNLCKTLPSQRECLGNPYIQADAHHTVHHIKYNTNAMATTLKSVGARCIVTLNTGMVCIGAPRVICVIETANVFLKTQEATPWCTPPRNHRQEQFDGHRYPQSPHHRGLSQTTNKCSFPEHGRQPMSAHVCSAHIGS